LGFWGIVIIVVYLAWAFGRKIDDGGEGERRREALRQAQLKWDTLQRRWQEEASDKSFLHKLHELNQKHAEYQGLPAAYQRDRLQLEANRHAAQLKRFLERHFIHRAQIKGVGPGLKATLASYGIETAADVTRAAVGAVPGFGPARTGEMLKWKAGIEAKFRFDPSKGVDPADIAALDHRYAKKRKDLEEALLHGPTELQQLRTQILRQREIITSELGRAATELAQAKADASLL